jgi:hypothetical protein
VDPSRARRSPGHARRRGEAAGACRAAIRGGRDGSPSRRGACRPPARSTTHRGGRHRRRDDRSRARARRRAMTARGRDEAPASRDGRCSRRPARRAAPRGWRATPRPSQARRAGVIVAGGAGRRPPREDAPPASTSASSATPALSFRRLQESRGNPRGVGVNHGESVAALRVAASSRRRDPAVAVSATEHRRWVTLPPPRPARSTAPSSVRPTSDTSGSRGRSTHWPAGRLRTAPSRVEMIAALDALIGDRLCVAHSPDLTLRADDHQQRSVDASTPFDGPRPRRVAPVRLRSPVRRPCVQAATPRRQPSSDTLRSIHARPASVTLTCVAPTVT